MSKLENLIINNNNFDMGRDQSISRLQTDCKMVHETEVHAYIFIKKELEKKVGKKSDLYSK